MATGVHFRLADYILYPLETTSNRAFTVLRKKY